MFNDIIWHNMIKVLSLCDNMWLYNEDWCTWAMSYHVWYVWVCVNDEPRPSRFYSSVKWYGVYMGSIYDVTISIEDPRPVVWVVGWFRWTKWIDLAERIVDVTVLFGVWKQERDLGYRGRPRTEVRGRYESHNWGRVYMVNNMDGRENCYITPCQTSIVSRHNF